MYKVRRISKKKAIKSVLGSVKNVSIDGIEYEGTIKVARMWSHYDTVR